MAIRVQGDAQQDTGHALTRPRIPQLRWICAALVIRVTRLATMPLFCPLALLNKLQKLLGAPSPGALPARQRRLPTGPFVSSPVSRRSAVPGYTSQDGVPANQLPKASPACLSASSRAPAPCAAWRWTVSLR